MSPNSSPPGTILVVDDEHDAADIIAILLQGMGLNTASAYSAREGLDQLDQGGDIRLVVSDIRMPGVDGFDFLRVVKHRFPGLPIVLTTGLPVTDDDVVPHGVVILEKPVSAEELRRAVAEQLQLRVGGVPNAV